MASRSFKPLLEKAGLPPTVRFHDLRHTCATLVLSEGINPKIAQGRLGHSTTSLTMDVYSPVMPDIQDQAAAAIDRALN